MRFSKKILFLILALVVLIGLLALLISVVRTPDSDTLPSATASPTPSATPEAQPADPSPTPSPTPDTSKPITVIDSDALTELVENYLRENNRSGNGIAISYCYTGTGEIWLYNGDTFSRAQAFTSCRSPCSLITASHAAISRRRVSFAA